MKKDKTNLKNGYSLIFYEDDTWKLIRKDKTEVPQKNLPKYVEALVYEIRMLQLTKDYVGDKK